MDDLVERTGNLANEGMPPAAELSFGGGPCLQGDASIGFATQPSGCLRVDAARNQGRRRSPDSAMLAGSGMTATFVR